MDSAAVREQITQKLLADPTATVDGLLGFWDLPGRISLRPSGRLLVAPEVSGKEQYYRQQAKDQAPPSSFRVECWRQMRQAEEQALRELRVPPETWRSLDELLTLDRARDAGRAYVRRIETLQELLDPREEDEAKLMARLLSGTGDSGPITPFLGQLLLLFGSYVWHVCLIERRPALIGTLSELAQLLGCCHRYASTVVALAHKKGLVRRLPRRERRPEGFQDRQGKRRARRRDTNAYEPGEAMRVAWLRLQTGTAPPALSARPAETATPPTETAATPGRKFGLDRAIPGGSREDRTRCDPTTREELNLGGASDGETGAPAPPASPSPPAPPPAQEAVPDPDQGQAQGRGAPSRQPAPARSLGGTPPRPAAASRLPRGRLIAGRSKMRASDGAAGPAPAAPGRAVVTPAQAATLPGWYARELTLALSSGAPRAAGEALLQRARLWLTLTEGGASAAEADAAVARLRAEQEQLGPGGAGAVCSPQPRGRP